MSRAAHVVERNLLTYKHAWWVVVTGAVEPLFFLLGARLGIGELVGGIDAGNGLVVPYATFVGPALLATSAAIVARKNTACTAPRRIAQESSPSEIAETDIGVASMAS